MANYDLIALRIVDNTSMASTATRLFDPSDADHQSYQFIETPDPVFYLFLDQNTGFSQFTATMKILVADHDAPIELVGVIDNQIVGLTIIQPFPKSLESFGELQTMAEAIEPLQRNMAREQTQRERLADIGEAVAKVNHDIRNVFSSATLVSDAMLSSKDVNVRKSAPLVLRSLEEAVDLC